MSGGTKTELACLRDAMGDPRYAHAVHIGTAKGNVEWALWALVNLDGEIGRDGAIRSLTKALDALREARP